jgi:hypothetical protein
MAIKYTCQQSRKLHHEKNIIRLLSEAKSNWRHLTIKNYTTHKTYPYVHAVKADRSRGGVSPLILYLGIIWRGVVNFTLWTSPEKTPRCPTDRYLMVPTVVLDTAVMREKIPSTPLRVKPEGVNSWLDYT